MLRSMVLRSISFGLAFCFVLQSSGQSPPEQPSNRTDLNGDSLPARALSRIGTLRFRHGSRISGLTYFPDGGMVISSGQDNTVRLWEAATGKEIQRWETPGRDYPTSVAISPDGKWLAWGRHGTGIKVCVRNLVTGSEWGQFSRQNCWVDRVAFSPDSRLLATGASQHRVLVWDIENKQLLWQFDAKENTPFSVPIAFSPDGKLIASGGERGVVRLWSLADGKELKHFPEAPTYTEKEAAGPHFRGLVRGVAFAPDGRTVASCGSEPLISLWDVGTGKRIRQCNLPIPGGDVIAFSPDGKTLACSNSKGSIRVWDPITGHEKPGFEDRIGEINMRFAFSPDGQTLATTAGSTIRFWNVATAKEISPQEGHTGAITHCSLLADQQTLITAGLDGSLRHWELTTGKPKQQAQRLPVWDEKVFLSPDGKTAAGLKYLPTGEKILEVDLQLWDVHGQRLRTQLGRPNIVDVRFPADSKTMYTMGWDFKDKSAIVRSWDAFTGRPLHDVASNGSLMSFELSSDGSTMAVLGQEENLPLRILEVPSGKELSRVAARSKLLQSMTFSWDAKVLAVVDGPPYHLSAEQFEFYVHLWEVARGKKVRQLGGSSHSYRRVAFSPDGRTIATAGTDSGIILWEAASGIERLRLEGHAGSVEKLFFSADGKTLVSSGLDQTVLVWDVTGLRVANAIPGEKPQAGDVRTLWATLADTNGFRAYEAISQLTATPEQTVAFMRGQLRPAELPNAAAMDQWITDLDSSIFRVRESASEELFRVGQLAEPTLRKAVAAARSAESRRRLQQLLDQMETRPSPLELQAMHATEVLEQIGTGSARTLLSVLAKGAPLARQTQEAKAALGRMSKRPINASKE